MNRLRVHDTVVVTVPPGPDARQSGFEAVVLAFSGQTIALQALRKKDIVWLPGSVADTLVTFRGDERLIALRGKLYSVPPIGDLRFAEQSASEPYRRSSRIRFKMAIVVRQGASEVGTEYMTSEISPDGVLISYPGPVAESNRAVSFADPSTRAVVTGRAAMKRAGGGVAELHLPSDPINAEARRALGGLVIALSRTDYTRREVHDDGEGAQGC